MAWRRRRAKRERAELLAGVTKLCEEDITLLGEQLRRLDTEAAEHPLDEGARVDYQNALDAYESADRVLRKVTTPGEITAVTDRLNEGRYALACVRAQLAGAPRIEAGERPAVRTIEVGGQQVPYRDAFDSSVVLDQKYHSAAVRAGEYGGFPKFPAGGG